MSMDVFIRNQLALNVHKTLDEVVPHCIKLLTWLMEYQNELLTQPQLHLTQPLVECLVKAHLYLFECQDRFGKSLIDRCDAGNRFWSNFTYPENRQERIRELCTGILSTQSGQDHSILLYWMHKSLSDIQPGWSVLKNFNWREMRQYKKNVKPNSHLKQMHCLVRRICRLSTTLEVETALQRSMRLIKFDVWLHLFREPRHSPIHSQCLILQHMIYDWFLQSDQVTTCTNFVHNLYKFVTTPSNESRFWRCLEHKRLACGLIFYLTVYWQRNLPHRDLNKMQLSLNIVTSTSLPFEEAIYLTNLMFALRSPCRHQFFVQLRSSLTSDIVSHLMKLLNKIAFVHN